ncbi:MAG: LysR family transcriptional regulator [Gemmatimonadales bacterium]
MTADDPLGTFLVVADAQGFGRAARRLGVTQATVSYRVRRLEQSLGAKLIDRAPGRFRLSPTGVRLVELGERFMGALRELRAPDAPGDGAEAEPIRVGTVTGFGRYVLFPALVEVAPPRLECRFLTAEETFSAVAAGTLDFGYSYMRRASAALRFRECYREELVLIAPKTARWRRVDWRDGGAETVPWVTYVEYDYVFGTWFSRVLGRPPRALRPVAHFEELEETIDAVAAGWGASIVPEDSARRYGGRRIALVRPAEPCINPVYLVLPAKPLDHAREAAVERIQERITAAARTRVRAAAKRVRASTPA